MDHYDEPPVGRVDAAIEEFWNVARVHANLTHMPSYFGPTVLASVPPPVCSLGATPQEADAALAGLLDGSLTSLRTALREYALAAEPLPEPGALAIVTDGRGRPGALVVTSSVEQDDTDLIEHLRVLHRA